MVPAGSQCVSRAWSAASCADPHSNHPGSSLYVAVSLAASRTHLKGTSRKRPVFQRLDQSLVEVYSMLPSKRTLEPPIGPPVAMMGTWQKSGMQQNSGWTRAQHPAGLHCCSNAALHLQHSSSSQAYAAVT
jgi:hypothetical protein